MDAFTAVAQQVMMANGRLLFEEVKPTLTPEQARLTAAELAKSGLSDAELAPLVETVRPFRAELKRLFGEDA